MPGTNQDCYLLEWLAIFVLEVVDGTRIISQKYVYFTLFRFTHFQKLSGEIIYWSGLNLLCLKLLMIPE